MAPTLGLGYFPPLDKCLGGENRLISWRTTCDYLSTVNRYDTRGNVAVQRHLSDDYTQHLLAKPYQLFSSPSGQSHSAFETRTSAINITPSSNGDYDIHQIKEDAVWLSKDLKIDEVSALRIVVLEWQTRAQTRLASGFSEEETTTLEDALESSRFGTSVIQPLRNPNSHDFKSEQSRRTRLRAIYLSERLYVLKVSQLLLNAALTNAGNDKSSLPGNARTNAATEPWLMRIGESILNTQRNTPTFIDECLNAFEACVKSLESGSQWNNVMADQQQNVEETWGANMLIEMIHIMQILFLHFDSSTMLIPSNIVLKWYEMMDAYGFFNSMEPQYPSHESLIYPLQSMVSLLSLTILKLPLALDTLQDYANQSRHNDTQMQNVPYFFDRTRITKIVEIAFNAANRVVVPACPSIFALAIIFHNVRSLAEINQQSREDDPELENAVNDSSGFHRGSIDSLSASPILSRRRTLSGSSQTQVTIKRTLPEEISELISSHQTDMDVIQFMAKRAVDLGHVFNVTSNLGSNFCDRFNTASCDDTGLRMRRVLLELVRSSLGLISYIPEVLAAVVSIMTGYEGHKERSDYPQRINSQDPRWIFLEDDVLLERLFRVAQHRFPYESIPYLKLCQELVGCDLVDDDCMPLILPFLRQSSYFTQAIPEGFSNYELIKEEQNANFLKLTAGINVFDGSNKSHSRGCLEGSRMALMIGDNRGADNFFLQPETDGQLISEQEPFVIMWAHQYDCLAYLGKFLEQYNTRGITTEKLRASGDEDTVIEIIGLLTALVASSTEAEKLKNPGSTKMTATKLILEEASTGIDGNRDVVSVILDIFEATLLRNQLRPGDERTLDLLVNCLQFTQALVCVIPGRIWTFIVGSSLLDIDGGGGKFGQIISALEIPAGRFAFLGACVHLFRDLVEDAVTNTVLRDTSMSAKIRHENPDLSSTGIPGRMMKKILLIFEQTMVSVFERLSTWRFIDAEEKMKIMTDILQLFDNILDYAYGVDDNPNLNLKLTGVVGDAATHLSNAFLSSITAAASETLLRSILDGIESPASSLIVKPMRSWATQVKASLELAVVLIDIRRDQGLPISKLELQLFRSTPILVRLYVTDWTYRLPVITLLEALVQGIADTEGEPPSLLGQLGSETIMEFLEELSHLDKPILCEALEVGIWNFLSAVVSKRQRWLSICLLTGSPPKETLKKRCKPASEVLKSKALLTLALDSVVQRKSIKPHPLMSILQFVSLAEEHWPWAMTDLYNHPRFFLVVRHTLDNMKAVGPSKDFGNHIDNGYTTVIGSFFADILATYLHHSRQMGDYTFVKTLLTHLDYFSTMGVDLCSYNNSLHVQLNKNFDNRYPGCKLLRFKKTGYKKIQFGVNFYYDTQLAGKMLKFDSAWNGRNTSQKDQGFAAEFRRANVNLSITEAQISLLQSWKFLAVELSYNLAREKGLQKILFKVANSCLIANIENNLPENFFQSLLMTRADLCLTLLQRLIEVHVEEVEVTSLLINSWNAVRACGVSFESSFENSNSEYYRCLLKILFLAIQFQMEDEVRRLKPTLFNQLPPSSTSSRSHASSKVLNIILDILTTVVGKGFRSLTNTLHENPRNVLPADFALLTAILQASLQMPGIKSIYPQLSLQLVDSQVADFALTLYSWSDQFAVDGDPVYGELSVLLLLALSEIPIMAEHMAVDGVLTQITSAKITNVFRRQPAPGPFDEQPRLYAIWASGVLPLCLNLLHGVGIGIAGEIAAFLNHFPEELNRAAEGFNSELVPTASSPTLGCVCSSMVAEAQTLTLISYILDTIREAGPSAGVASADIPGLKWDKARLKEDIEGWLAGLGKLKNRILPTNEREEAMARQKAKKVSDGIETRLQEKVAVDLEDTLLCLGGQQSS